jgi:hypothetical protein
MCRWSSRKIEELLPSSPTYLLFRYKSNRPVSGTGLLLFWKYPPYPSLVMPTPNAAEESATAWHARIENRTAHYRFNYASSLPPALSCL